MQFLAIFIRAFHVLYEHRWALLKSLSLPLILAVIFDVAVDIFKNEILSDVEFFIVSPYLYIVIAITTHRIILLGDDAVTIGGVFVWKWREIRFLLLLVAVVAMALVLLVPSIIPIIGSVISFLLMGWIISRFCLVFPTTAIDAPVTLRQSWEMTREYQLLMALVVFGVPLLVALPVLFFNVVTGILWLNNFVSSLTTIVEVGTLSVTYKYIQQELNFERF